MTCVWVFVIYNTVHSTQYSKYTRSITLQLRWNKYFSWLTLCRLDPNFCPHPQSWPRAPVLPDFVNTKCCYNIFLHRVYFVSLVSHIFIQSAKQIIIHSHAIYMNIYISACQSYPSSLDRIESLSVYFPMIRPSLFSFNTYCRCTKVLFRCDSISTFDHVTQSVTTLYQNITKKTFITYMATFRNY